MTKAQIVHALRIVDDVHRLGKVKDVPPGGWILIRSDIESVFKAVNLRLARAMNSMGWE